MKHSWLTYRASHAFAEFDTANQIAFGSTSERRVAYCNSIFPSQIAQSTFALKLLVDSNQPWAHSQQLQLYEQACLSVLPEATDLYSRSAFDIFERFLKTNCADFLDSSKCTGDPGVRLTAFQKEWRPLAPFSATNATPAAAGISIGHGLLSGSSFAVSASQRRDFLTTQEALKVFKTQLDSPTHEVTNIRFCNSH